MNLVNLTKLLSLVKGFDFLELKPAVESLQAATLRRDEHLATWAKSSTSMAWSLGLRMTATLLLLPQAVVPQLLLVIAWRFQQTCWGENFAHTAIEEPLSHTEGEKADMDTEEAAKKEQPKEPEVEKTPHQEFNSLTPSLKFQFLQPTGLVIDITPLKHLESPPVALKVVRGKGISTDDVESPKKIVKALRKVRHGPDEPHLDKEEKIKKTAEEAKLLGISKPELIKVVQEEATKARVDQKILGSAKGGQEFKKIQVAELKVLHSEKIKRSRELRKKRIEKGMICTDMQKSQENGQKLDKHKHGKGRVYKRWKFSIKGLQKSTLGQHWSITRRQNP
ncbi:hypothetical protein Tco_0200009 [Tanacetum coccineum]